MKCASASRGFALAYFLLFGLLIAMFVVALLAVGEQGLRTTRGGVDRTRALYAAEAGLARAVAEMERDPAWSAGFPDPPMPGGTATYSATFEGAGKDVCLNNLLSSTPTDSYHGPLTVPAFSAQLVVTGRSGSATRTVEALVVTGANISVSDALTATGPIRLGGEVMVDGRKSLVDAASRPANLHHNSNQDGLGVLYNGGAASWEQIAVSGEITSSSSDDEASIFVFHTPHSVPDTSAGVPLKELPRPNITAMLDDHNGLSGPPIPATAGLLTLNGDSYYGGDVTVNGDLKLKDGAKLYVRGNLLVNGSIQGKGTVVVGGTSEFYGSAEISGQESEYIALLSRQGVVLKGFQGETYMRALSAGSAEVAQRWEDTSWALRGLNSILKANADTDPLIFQKALMENDFQIDIYQAVLANHPIGRNHMEQIHLVGRSVDNANYFANLLGGGSSLSTQAFLVRRFQHLDDWFRQGQYRRDGAPVNRPPDHMGLDELTQYPEWNPPVDGGMFDSIQSLHQEDWWHEGDLIPGHAFTPAEKGYIMDAIAAVQEFDYDRLGNANFKGLIYTSGAFVGRDDVTVQGTVIVNGDSTVADLVDGGVTYHPGEVGLFGHSRLTRVDEFFDDGVHNLMGAGALDIKRWISR